MGVFWTVRQIFTYLKEESIENCCTTLSLNLEH